MNTEDKIDSRMKRMEGLRKGKLREEKNG